MFSCSILAELGFEGATETAPGTVQEHSLVAFSHAEDLAGVGRRQSLDIAQSQDIPLRGRQLIDGDPDGLVHSLRPHSILDLVHPMNRWVGPRPVSVEPPSIYRPLWVLDRDMSAFHQA